MMTLELRNSSYVPFEDAWMKYMSVVIITEYVKDARTPHAILVHNVPLMHAVHKNKFRSQILMDANVLKYDDLRYWVYLVPHMTAEDYGTEEDGFGDLAHSTHVCQRMHMDSENVLLLEGDVDLWTVLQLSPVHPLLSLPYQFVQKKQFTETHESKFEICVPIPEKDSIVEEMWTRLEENVVKSLPLKGYLITGETVDISFRRIKKVKRSSEQCWLVTVAIGGMGSHSATLWRVVKAVGKRIWSYYNDNCVVYANEKMDIDDDDEKSDSDMESDNGRRQSRFGKVKKMEAWRDKFVDKELSLCQGAMKQLKQLQTNWEKLCVLMDESMRSQGKEALKDDDETFLHSLDVDLRMGICGLDVVSGGEDAKICVERIMDAFVQYKTNQMK